VNTEETELLFERIDELTTACDVLRERLEQQRNQASETIEQLNAEIKKLRQMVDRLQLHLAQGVEL
jgi:predicted  nucleic acid-binding Zn-ribbon protein